MNVGCNSGNSENWKTGKLEKRKSGRLKTLNVGKRVKMNGYERAQESENPWEICLPEDRTAAYRAAVHKMLRIEILTLLKR